MNRLAHTLAFAALALTSAALLAAAGCVPERDGGEQVAAVAPAIGHDQAMSQHDCVVNYCLGPNYAEIRQNCDLPPDITEIALVDTAGFRWPAEYTPPPPHARVRVVRDVSAWYVGKQEGDVLIGLSIKTLNYYRKPRDGSDFAVSCDIDTFEPNTIRRGHGFLLLMSVGERGVWTVKECLPGAPGG